MSRDLFRQVAPRLELAHRQRREAIAERRRIRSTIDDAVLELERLVAHRELQAMRAARRCALPDRARRDYVLERERKLTAARRRLDELKAERRAFVLDPDGGRR